MSEVVCRTCGATVAMRISRTGFWQQRVLGHFGIYPWKCGGCGVVFLYRKRGIRSGSKKHGTESQGLERRHGSHP
jgi:hypothetical protein